MERLFGKSKKKKPKSPNRNSLLETPFQQKLNSRSGTPENLVETASEAR